MATACGARSARRVDKWSGVCIPPPHWFLRLASLYSAFRHDFISKHCQLKRFDWLSEEDAVRCILVARQRIVDLESAEFEVELSCASYTWWSGGRGLELPEEADDFSDDCSQTQAGSVVHEDHAEVPTVAMRAPIGTEGPRVARVLMPDPTAEALLLAAPEAQLLPLTGDADLIAGPRSSLAPENSAARIQTLSAEGSRPVTIEGILDVVTPTAVWELKCVGALRSEHFLQVRASSMFEASILHLSP